MGLPLRRLFFLLPSSANPAWRGTLQYGPARHSPRRAPCQDSWVPPAPGHMVAPMPAQVKYPNTHTDGGICAHACAHTHTHARTRTHARPPTHLLPAHTSTTRQVRASGADAGSHVPTLLLPAGSNAAGSSWDPLPAECPSPCPCPRHAEPHETPELRGMGTPWVPPSPSPPIPQPPTYCVPARAGSCNQRQPPAAPCPPPAPVSPCRPPRHCCRVSLHFSF